MVEIRRIIEASIVGIVSVLIGLIILWVFAKWEFVPSDSYNTSNWNKNYALEITLFAVGFIIYFISARAIELTYYKYDIAKKAVSEIL